MRLLDAQATAAALPWQPLMAAIESLLAAQQRGEVQVPERSVHTIGPHTHWFLMPAWRTGSDGALAIAKLITYNPHNPARGLPAILGDVLVLKADTGERLALLDGPTVTARRTAAVTAVAARHLAREPGGPLLMFGAGAQAGAHLEVFREVFGVRELWLRSRGAEGAQRLLARARALGLQAHMADDLQAALQRCPLVVTATPAAEVCLHSLPRDDAFVAAVGAFTPTMAELAPAVVRHLAGHGRVVLDTAAARHEAGDLLQAGLAVRALPTLGEVLAAGAPRPQATLFKSCGSALWDLAAAYGLAR
ncbi:MAG: delta(1)-pyrroline-2-carboxylate reductase family protein [Pseudomonadota bacterium]